MQATTALSFEIASSNIDAVAALLDKINLKANKNGFLTIDYSFKKAAPMKVGVSPEGDSIFLERSIVTLLPPTVDLNNYTLIAKIDKSSGESPLISTWFFNDVPEKYLKDDCPSNCEHCNTLRNRNVTYLLKNRVNNSIIQVGSSCIDEYIGFPAGEALKYYDLSFQVPLFFKGLDKEIDSDSFSISSSRYIGISPDILLATTMAVVDAMGGVYVSSSKALQGDLTTGDLIKAQFYSSKPYFSGLNRLPFLEKAEQIIDWVLSKGIPDHIRNTSLGHNIEAMIHNNFVPAKNTSMMCSVLPIYESAKLKDLLKEKTKYSEYQADENEKIERTITWDSSFEIDGDWGPTQVRIFHDENGNVYKYNSASHNQFVAKNVPYEIKATVKKHNEYKSIKQTDITRVKYPAIDLTIKFASSIKPTEWKKMVDDLDPDLLIRLGSGITANWKCHAFSNHKLFNENNGTEKLSFLLKSDKHRHSTVEYLSNETCVTEYLLFELDECLSQSIRDFEREALIKYLLDQSIESGVNVWPNRIDRDLSWCGSANKFKHIETIKYVFELAKIHEPKIDENIETRNELSATLKGSNGKFVRDKDGKPYFVVIDSDHEILQATVYSIYENWGASQYSFEINNRRHTSIITYEEFVNHHRMEMIKEGSYFEIEEMDCKKEVSMAF